jgi:type III secretion protein J
MTRIRNLQKLLCSFWLLLLSSLMCLSLTGCSNQEIYSKLTEQQANEMVALLRGSGLSAEKSAQEGGQFSINTAASDFSQAVQILKTNGYPKEAHESMGQVFKKEGFVSSPLEERARLTYALSQEIGNTISSIDGVLMARVHVAVPEKDPLAENAKPASASVFIKHRAGMDLTSKLGQIKGLVVNAIEGLPYDNVTVALFPADPWPTVGVKPVADPTHLLNDAFLVGGGVGSLVALGGSALWLWSRRKKKIIALSRGA